MGGIRIDVNCRTSSDGLFAAGEDAGGVQGVNRLGGNGVADSTVFGASAGDVQFTRLTPQEWKGHRERASLKTVPAIDDE